MSNTIKTSVASVLDSMGLPSLLNINRDTKLLNSELRRREKIAVSPQFENGKAIARMPKVPSPESMLSVTWKLIAGRQRLRPKVALPHIPVDVEHLSQRSHQPRVTWLGHSSLFIEMDQVRFLIDPVFEHASPWIAKSWFNRNVQSPVSREQLPRPDVIVISHDHYDHLEASTAKFYAEQGVMFFVPLAVGRHLENWGVDPDQILEFDWWDEVTFKGIRLVATPANHNSGRAGIDSNATLWCSWALVGQSGSLFYSGDTAYDSHFTQIADKLGPFDMAFIEVAANVKQDKGFPVENWGHMQARHTVHAFHDLNAAKLCPIHWSTYELFSHQWDEPMLDLLEEANASGVALVTPMVGQTFSVLGDHPTHRWWESVALRDEPTQEKTLEAVGISK